MPTADASGFPPKVLKCNALVKHSEISGVVITAPKGNPFPIPKRYYAFSFIRLEE